MTNLDVNIFCFALFALFVSPPYFRQFAQWVRRLRTNNSHRAHDGLVAAGTLFLFGLFYPFFFLSQITDEITNPSNLHAAPLWGDGMIAVAVLLLLVVLGQRIRRLVLFMRAPRHHE